MKRILSSFVVLILALTLSACGGTDKGNIPASTPISTIEPTVQNLDQFVIFETALTDSGYIFEKVDMAAEMLGAESGAKYKFDFGTVELYMYDKDSDAYQAALSSGKVTLEGIGDFEATINNGMAIIIDVSSNEEAILELFNNLK